MGRCDVAPRQCLDWHVREHLRNPRRVIGSDGQPADSYRALCPAHKDTDPSLSISAGQHHVVWQCFAQCDSLAVRAALIYDGVPADCLPITKADTEELVDRIAKLYAGEIGHAELRWRVWSLIHGFGGEMPPKGRYPGGRRGFITDAGVGHSEFYGDNR